VKDGLLITLGEGRWSDLEEVLLTTVVERESFLRGAKVALDVGNQILHAAELGGLRDKLSERGLSLWAVLSNSPVTEQTAQMLGLATRISTPRPERSIRALDTNISGDQALLVQRTIRSGFKISHHGHVVVIGDVNPGGEILAGGSVVVWGKLKGSVHAGMEGNASAVVCALEMDPMHLRIADYTKDSAQRRGKQEPEMWSVKEGRLVSETWKAKKS
jgi:septum site-determining protein MinC